ncbi:MAG: hypothetical protein NUK54_05780 [Methanothrix sp.]|nr:hypothetical protein [Methanothrix sp.]
MIKLTTEPATATGSEGPIPLGMKERFITLGGALLAFSLKAGEEMRLQR